MVKPQRKIRRDGYVMTCPNCGLAMKDKCYKYYGLSDWDMDYPTEVFHRFTCKACKISFDDDKGWKIPKTFERPTDKQIKCVEIINRVLCTDFVPLLKISTTLFIKENIEKSRQRSKHHIRVDEYSLNERCINDAWCEEY